MKLKNYQIYDIVADRRSLGYEIFRKEIEHIGKEGFELRSNYLNINLDEYHCFTVLCEGERLVAFSGLQAVGPWGSRVSRLSTRFYLAEAFRTKGLMSYHHARENHSSHHTGSYYLNPYQIKVALEKGLDGVFVSREKPQYRRMLKAIAQRCSDLEPSGYKYILLEDVYNVCRRLRSNTINNQPGCWQSIIAVPFNDRFELPLPKLSLSEWRESFAKTADHLSSEH